MLFQWGKLFLVLREKNYDLYFFLVSFYMKVSLVEGCQSNGWLFLPFFIYEALVWVLGHYTGVPYVLYMGRIWNVRKCNTKQKSHTDPFLPFLCFFYFPLLWEC